MTGMFLDDPQHVERIDQVHPNVSGQQKYAQLYRQAMDDLLDPPAPSNGIILRGRKFIK